MALPQINIHINKDGLGRVPSLSDGVIALLITGTKTKAQSANNSLYTTPQLITAVSQLEALLITSNTEAAAYTQIVDFYNTAGNGAQLWVQLIAKDQTFTKLLETSGKADNLVNTTQGKINVLGISHGELSGTALKTAVGGIKGGVQAAVPLAQAFAIRQQANSQPLQVIIAGNEVSALGELTDYAEESNNYVSLLISGNKAGSKVAALGVTLGTLARLPVQRSLARVKNGALPISTATFTDGTTVEKNATSYTSYHDKRYLFFRNYIGQSGYYVTDDITLTATTDDLSTIARGRTISKAVRLTYTTYVQEIAEEIFVEEDGKLAQANVKYLESKVENVINETMTNTGEISSIQAFIDPEQNVLSTDKLTVQLNIIPVGYTKTVVVNIGFTQSTTT